MSRFQTSQDSLRQRQISALVSSCPGVRTVTPNVIYDVPCYTAGFNLTLRINLAPTFPQSAPTVSVYPPVRHAWVNEQNLVSNMPQLRTWSMHSSLGKIMQDLVSELQRNPPYVVGFQQQQQQQAAPPQYGGYGGGSLQPPVSAGPGAYGGRYSPQPGYGGAAAAAGPAEPATPLSPTGSTGNGFVGNLVPAIPSSIPELESLSTARLQELSDSDAKFIELYESLGIVKALQKVAGDLNDDIERLARKNLEYEPRLTAAKQRLAEQHELLAEKRRTFDELMAKQQEMTKAFSPDAILMQLQVAAREAEEEAETLSMTFQDGDMDVDAFLDQFMKKRTLFHMRKAKADQLQRTLRH